MLPGALLPAIASAQLLGCDGCCAAARPVLIGRLRDSLLLERHHIAQGTRHVKTLFCTGMEFRDVFLEWVGSVVGGVLAGALMRKKCHHSHTFLRAFL